MTTIAAVCYIVITVPFKHSHTILSQQAFRKSASRMSTLITLFDITPLASQLASGQLVLTVNQRLASRIQAAYAIYCNQHGQSVVQAPAVYSLNTWLERQWQQLLINAHPTALRFRLLSAAQERLIWQQIVEATPLPTPLLRPVATAQQASSAYRTLVEWRQDLSNPLLRAAFETDDDCAVFLGWVDQFEQRCQQQLWLPRAKLAEQLLVIYQQGELQPIESIIGVGFDDISPLHQALLDAQGSFRCLENSKKAPRVNTVGCDDPHHEILSSAVWAKKVLCDNPGATVALVFPQLSQQRQTIQRVLQEVFEPDYNGVEQPRRNLPFNLSAGSPLLHTPMISAALNALMLCLPTVELEQLVELCQSPFYCLSEADSQQIVTLLDKLYAQRSTVISTARFRQLAQQVSESSTQAGAQPLQQDQQWEFAQSLQQLANCGRALTQKQRRPSQWVAVIADLLCCIAWPGCRRLDSIEYQQLVQWQHVLEQLATLDSVAGAISFAQALVQLKSLLSNHIFQPQTADSSLQVLGTLEAAGLEFSHIWLHSMSAQQWPASPSPNALIPFHLQRQFDMPQATPSRELEYAQRLSRRFLHSAETVVISYPALLDENPTRVSAVFEHIEQTDLAQLLGKELYALIPLREIRRRHIESASLQNYQAGDAPPLGRQEKVTGGSALFANQSACPFRAFAMHRLGVAPLPSPSTGLDAADRGSILHRALELVWSRLKDQRSLLEHTQTALEQLCQEVADYAIGEHAHRKDILVGVRYRALESVRLKRLLLDWLGIEQQRQSFVVEKLEMRKPLRFAELELQTRIDRIDRLDDGSLLVIDYKTGLCSISRWWGERPEEPQLPLYSLLVDNTLTADTVDCASDTQPGVQGIAFAQVRVDGCGLKGVGSQHVAEPMVQWHAKLQSDAQVENWMQLKSHWQKTLTRLAKDFIAGKSAVDPKQPPQTCQYCQLGPLCRVNHQEFGE